MRKSSTLFGRRGVARWRRAAVLAVGVLAAAPARAGVELIGVDDAQRANIFAYLDFGSEPCDEPHWRLEQQYQGAVPRIREALEALGYYAPDIQGTLEYPDKCWHARFTIAPGEPIRIRGFDVAVEGEATADPAFAAALTDAGLRNGAVLDHGAYERLKRRWSDLARERGYPEAKFTANRIDVYPPERVADVALRFDSGPRYHFGDVAFRQDVLDSALVEAYLPFHAGDPYDATKLTALYVVLADSGYFKSIDIRPLAPEGEHRAIPIDIQLTGAPRRQITYGVGFSTDTGPRFRFGRTNRRFNEGGHQFGVNAQLSPVISEVTANYRMPMGDPRKEWLSFDVGLKRENTDTAQSDSLELGARRVYERPGNWTRTQMLNFVVEDFEIAEQIGRSHLLMPGIDWTRLRTDNEIRPTRGSKLDFEVRGAADALASDTTFAQISVQGKWIWSLPKQARFIVRGQVGTTASDEFQKLPPSVRFFAGGDNSVRGYDFKALGPVDSLGKVIGGESLAVGSFEYEHPLRARWSIALFVDSGNAFDGASIDAKTGVGIGGRWQSPLGPIRVDLAHPLDDPDTSLRLHISLGPDL